MFLLAQVNVLGYRFRPRWKAISLIVNTVKQIPCTFSLLAFSSSLMICQVRVKCDLRCDAHGWPHLFSQEP